MVFCLNTTTTTTVLRPLYTGQSSFAGTSSLELEDFVGVTARMPLLAATSAIRLGKRRWSSQQCYLHCLRAWRHTPVTYTRLTALFLGLPGWAGTRKVKRIWILLKQETVSGNGISWAICISAPRCRQITMPVPHHSVFYRPDALPAAQPTASKHWRHMPGDSVVFILILLYENLFRQLCVYFTFTKMNDAAGTSSVHVRQVLREQAQVGVHRRWIHRLFRGNFLSRNSGDSNRE